MEQINLTSCALLPNPKLIMRLKWKILQGKKTEQMLTSYCKTENRWNRQKFETGLRNMQLSIYCDKNTAKQSF